MQWLSWGPALKLLKKHWAGSLKKQIWARINYKNKENVCSFKELKPWQPLTYCACFVGWTNKTFEKMKADKLCILKTAGSLCFLRFLPGPLLVMYISFIHIYRPHGKVKWLIQQRMVRFNYSKSSHMNYDLINLLLINRETLLWSNFCFLL